jgi:hypothetical protein
MAVRQFPANPAVRHMNSPSVPPPKRQGRKQVPNKFTQSYARRMAQMPPTPKPPGPAKVAPQAAKAAPAKPAPKPAPTPQPKGTKGK